MDRQSKVRLPDDQTTAEYESLLSPFANTAFQSSPQGFNEDGVRSLSEWESPFGPDQEAGPFQQTFQRNLAGTIAADELEEEFADEDESAWERDEFLDEDAGTYEEGAELTEGEEEPSGEEATYLEEEPNASTEAPIESAEEEARSTAYEGTFSESEAALDGSLVEPEEEELAWETLEFEESPAIPAGVAEFAVNLGKEWAKRRNGSPPAEKITEWLLQDYRDTLEGGHSRFKKYPGDNSIGRAWMISRQEQMKFQTSSSAGVKPLRNFQPPSSSVALVSDNSLIQYSDRAPVAPIVLRFVQDLRQRYQGPLDVSTYRGHGGGKFQNRGYSVDLFLQGRDDRGFYPPEEALKFLRALNETAKTTNADWRVIYNDFSVADTVGQETGQGHVIFVGKVSRDKNKKIVGLNWHGPHPLILHFHLDLAPRAGGPMGPGSVLSAITARHTPRPTKSTSGKPPVELVRFAQRVLNATEGQRLKVDGDLGPRTRDALEGFRRKYNLGAGGALDGKTVLALAQRALEGLAQQSLFEKGKSDSATEQALSRFKTQLGLVAKPTLDAATRTALADVLERRGALLGTAPTGKVVDWAQVPANERMRYVMDLLAKNHQYPVSGAAGMVGNLWAESALIPNRIEGSKAETPMRAPDFNNVLRDFTADEAMNRDHQKKTGPKRPGIGLAQWTSRSRREGLFSHTFQGQKLGPSILYDMNAQVHYLVSELASKYKRVDQILRKKDVTLEEASDEVVYNYEVPGSILSQPGPDGRRRKLPRHDPAVAAVFAKRRRHSQNALRAYATQQREIESVA